MFYCAGNWKLNKNPAHAAQYIQQLIREAPQDSHANLLVFPPALCAQAVNDGLKGSAISWGGQNCYFASSGAFTGENSAQTLKEMGARYCLVGHSERRQIFHEDDAVVAKKVRAVQEAGLKPILCVGETLTERQGNKTKEVILRQLKMAASGELIIAYEPVWAIGTGQVANQDQVEEAHALLRAEAGANTPILYGGSVKPDNAKQLAKLPNVNGFLIGGASLKADEFLKIYSNARSV